MTLTHAHKGGGIAVVQGGIAAPQGQPLAQGVILPVGIAQIGPAGRQLRTGEGLGPGGFGLPGGVARGGGSFHHRGDGLPAVDHRPAVFVPGHRGDHGFPAHVVEHELGRPNAVEDDPPLTGGVLHQVGVAQGLGESAAGIDVPGGEDGVVGAALKGTPGGVTAGNGLHVTVFCAALGNHQIVLVPAFVHVGTLGAFASGAVPDGPGLGEHLSRGQVQSALANALASGFVKVGAVEVHRAVVVPQQGGVDAALLHIDGLGPGTLNVIGPDEEVAAASGVGGDHVEPAVVTADGGGIDAAAGPAACQGKLAVPGEDVAHLFPVEQVPAVPKGNAGEELKGTVHQVVILSNPADAGIGIEPGQNGVCITNHFNTLLSCSL